MLANKSRAKRQTEPARDIGHLSVLVVDDDDFILDVMVDMLENMGVGHVAGFNSAKNALPLLDVDSPNQVLVCDLNMPEMDGIEVIRFLAEIKFSGAIIVLSGEDTRTLQTVVNVGRAHHLRLLGALGKPVARGALMHLLQSARNDSQEQEHANILLTVSELQAGLDGEALVPYFQPQVDAVTRKVVGVEALARWRHAGGGILGPGAFIPVAESSGLIVPLTDRMITLSLQQWKAWHDAGLDLTISVNISMHSLNRIDFPEWLLGQAQCIGVPLSRLVLEITESQLPQDMLVSSDVLARLCLKRVCLSIDDFGTAYSNMEKLQMLPFGELKIDKAFVHGAAQNPSSYAILKSSTELARQMDMKVVAEGVETQEDWDCAAGLGCDLVQGFFAARPMAGDQLLGWVARWEEPCAE